jgi:hypothetical protein
MEIEFVILADSVQAVGGKLFMLGGAWDQWPSQAFPAPIQIGLGISLMVPWDETNQKLGVSIAIQDSDGKDVVPQINGQFEVGRPPGLRPGVTQRSLMAINAGFQIPSPGRYEIRVFTPDGTEKRVAFEALVASQGTIRLS